MLLPQAEEGSYSLNGFVINMHALHNAHLIRETLPRDLTKPVPVFNAVQRQSKHNQWAKYLRVTGPAKRKAAKEKAAATRKKNKARAADVGREPASDMD